MEAALALHEVVLPVVPKPGTAISASQVKSLELRV